MIGVTKTAGGQTYSSPFIGPVDYVTQNQLDVSALDGSDLVDSDGYLKPGAPLKIAGGVLVPLDGTASEAVERVVIEPIKVAKSNSTADLTAASDLPIAVLAIGVINRAIAEDNLGRAYNADELAGFGTNIILQQ